MAVYGFIGACPCRSKRLLRRASQRIYQLEVERTGS